jgi:hypothetical protein
MELAVEAMAKRAMETSQRSMPRASGPALGLRLGWVAVQPEIAAAGNEGGAQEDQECEAVSQKLAALRMGRPCCGADLCGRMRLPKPACGAVVRTKKSMMVPWMVTIAR